MNIWQDKFKNFKEAKKFQKGKGFSGKKWKSSQFKLLIDCKNFTQKKNSEKHTKRYKDLLFILNKLFKKKIIWTFWILVGELELAILVTQN